MLSVALTVVMLLMLSRAFIFCKQSKLVLFLTYLSLILITGLILGMMTATRYPFCY